MNEFNEIIKEICEEEKIVLNNYQDDWLKELIKDNKVRYIVGYKFALNNQSIGVLVDDKGLFYDIIKSKLPIIEHKVIFQEYDKDDVLNYFHKNNDLLIIKGNIGTCGREVYRVDNENRLFKVINRLFRSQYSISLCPYYNISNEYRLIVLNNDIKLVYAKENPTVVGDGVKTIRELLLEFNKYFYKDNHVKNEDYIPKLGEKVIVEYRFNLSNGSRVNKDVDNILKNKLIDMAKEVIKYTNLSFGSIDIIKTYENELFIMEANSGVMMNNYLMQTNDYDLVKDIYKEAIISMFKE